MNIQEKIKQQLIAHPIVLYMKGTPIYPQCGFSSNAVNLLEKCLEPITDDQKKDILYVNILEDMALREGIKQYSQWPTIPQLYIQGEFIGGSDILTALFNSGQLQQKIKSALVAV